MNRVNPLHVGILLCVLFVFVLFKLSEAKEELREAKKDYKETMKVATKLDSIAKTYSGKKAAIQALQRILKQSSLKSAEIEQKIGSSSIVLSSNSMSKTALNSLMSKILNGSYKIVSLKIKKLSKKTASLEMEIKW